MVLPYIDMNLPWVYMSSQSWTPLPPHIISLDHRNTGLPIHLGIICGCFCDTRAEWRAVTQITWPKKSELFTIWEMTKKLHINPTATCGCSLLTSSFYWTESPDLCSWDFFWWVLGWPWGCLPLLCSTLHHSFSQTSLPRLPVRWLPAAWVWLR